MLQALFFWTSFPPPHRTDNQASLGSGVGAAVLTQGDGETEECSRGHLQGQGRRGKWVSYRRALGWAGRLQPGVQGRAGILRPKGALPGMRQQRAREDQRRGPAKKARSVCEGRAGGVAEKAPGTGRNGSAVLFRGRESGERGRRIGLEESRMSCRYAAPRSSSGGSHWGCGLTPLLGWGHPPHHLARSWTGDLDAE